MNRDVSYLRKLLAPADPVPGRTSGDAEACDAEGQAALTRILDSSRARFRPDARVTPAHPHRRVGALTAGAAAVIALVAVFVTVAPFRGGPAPAFAVTPPALNYEHAAATAPPASDVLMDLAERAAVQPWPEEPGPYYYSKFRTWWLDSAIRGGETCSVVVPEVNAQWLAADGSGRLVNRSGEPWVPSGDSGPLCRDAGASQEPGTWKGSFPARSHMAWDADRLSRDPRTLAGQIFEQDQFNLNSTPDSIRVVLVLGGVQELSGPVPPELRAALLRVLAGTEDAVYRGQVTDRAGREGIAVSVNSSYGGSPARHTLIFDRETAALLGYEKVLTETDGALNVPIPAVISYVTYLESGFTDSAHHRP